MPIYQYVCDACAHEEEEFQRINDDPISECPVCHKPAYHRVPCLPHTNLVEFHKPVEMHSLALCHADDIAAFKRKYPQVEMSDNPDHPLYGVPLAANRQQKLAVLAGEGWEEKK
jgi:putative FmdB family regulatory protein